MSYDPLRIAFVAEGPTDFIILKSVIANFLKGRDFVAQVLQPEISEAFKPIPGRDGGWPGVYRWCLQATDQGGGRIIDNPLFMYQDLLVFHLDADVACAHYSEGHINDPIPQAVLPCEEPCPPPSATTNRLRLVALKWLNEKKAPHQLVLCTPSKSLETWVLIGLFPNSRHAKEKDLECQYNSENILQGKPKERRLVKSGKKDLEMYKQFAPEVARNWGTINSRCSEAARFEKEFLSAVEMFQNRKDFL
jgi:hypothetical protein